MDEDFEFMKGFRTGKRKHPTSRRCADHREHLWEQNLVSHGTVTVISRKAMASRLGGPRIVYGLCIGGLRGITATSPVVSTAPPFLRMGLLHPGVGLYSPVLVLAVLALDHAVAVSCHVLSDPRWSPETPSREANACKAGQRTGMGLGLCVRFLRT